MQDDAVRDDAVEQVAATRHDPPLLLSCEHASNRLPEGWAWPEADAWLVGEHWAWDPGAATLTRALAAELGAPAVLSRFSRLLVDPNRPLDSDTLFRGVADGRAVALNASVSEADAAARVARCYTPYHAAFDAMVAAHPGVPLLSMHTYTPSYEGQRRDVQLGVLFDDDEPWALRWFEALRGCGYDVRLNEPWSGRKGLMYAAQRHARQHGRLSVEIEVRNDLAQDPAEAARIVALIVAAIPG